MPNEGRREQESIVDVPLTLWFIVGFVAIVGGSMSAVLSYGGYQDSLAGAKSAKAGHTLKFLYTTYDEQYFLREARRYQRQLRWSLVAILAGLFFPILLPVALLAAVVVLPILGVKYAVSVTRAAFAPIPPKDWETEETNDETATEVAS